MKPTTLIPLLACSLALVAAPAPGAPGATWEEQSYLRLLKLDVQEAANHAKFLAFEARHGLEGSRVVLRRHVSDLGANLAAIQEDVDAIQTVDGDERFDFQIGEIRNHAGLAREAFDLMNAEAMKGTPNARQIAQQAAVVFDEMIQATSHANRAGSAHRVAEPPRPTRED